MATRLLAGGDWSDTLVQAPTVITFSATPVLDITQTNSLQITLTANVTSSTIVGTPADATSFKLRIVQDATGSRTFVFPTTFRFASGTNGSSTSPTLTTTASKADEFVFRYDAATGLYFEVMRNFNLPTS